MRIGENTELYKTNEDLKTSIDTLLRMPPTVKEAYYKTSEGQHLLKGIVMQAENNRPDNKQLGTSWTPEEIEELNEEIRKASNEDRELILALLPSPVISCLHNRMGKTETLAYDNWTKVKNADLGEGGRKDISKGAKTTDPGYQQWLEKIRAKRAAKVNPDAMTRPTKFDSKQPKQPKPYKHFLRRVGKDAKIVDKPIYDDKS